MATTEAIATLCWQRSGRVESRWSFTARRCSRRTRTRNERGRSRLSTSAVRSGRLMNTDRNSWRTKGDNMKAIVISVLALMIVACAAAGVWAQQAMPAQDVKSLAGKWVGRMTPSNQVLELQIQPDGSYTSVRGTTTGQGTITMVGGKLMADGYLVTGPNVTTAGPEK